MHRSRAALSAILVACCASTGWSQERRDPPTLESLQKELDELRARFKKTPATSSDRATMKVFGRIHLDVWSFPATSRGVNVIETGDPAVDPVNNIEFRRARIGVSGDVDENMLYKIELEFGHPDEFSFKDLFFGFKGLPILRTLRIGNQKRPYGLDHLNSSRYNVFLERPFVIEANNQDARRLGIVSYGVSEDQAWNWRWGVYEMTDWAKVGEVTSDTFQPELTGRIANTAWWEDEGRNYAHLALSGSVGWPNGDPDIAAGDDPNRARYRTRPEARSQSRWIDTGRVMNTDVSYLVGAEGVLNIGPAQIVGEYQNVWLDRGDGFGNRHFHGGYVYAAYFLTGEHMPWSRKTGILGRIKPFRENSYGAWQVALRYSFADYEDQEIRGGDAESWTMGLNWYWNKHASVQFNYVSGRIGGLSDTVGGTTFDGGDYDILGVRFRIDF